MEYRPAYRDSVGEMHTIAEPFATAQEATEYARRRAVEDNADPAGRVEVVEVGYVIFEQPQVEPELMPYTQPVVTNTYFERMR